MDLPFVYELLSKPEQFVKKNKEAIVYCSDLLEIKSFSYSDLIATSTRISCELQQLNAEKCVILVILPLASYLLPPILFGIMKSSCTFYCVRDVKNPSGTLRDCRINFFITHLHPDTFLWDHVNCHELEIFGERIFLCKYKETEAAKETNHIAYGMRTSGSTGDPKMIWVPWACILPNISSLSQKLNITENDVIYSTSPATFDPFIVDLLLMIANTATIFFTTERLRIAPTRKFAEILFLSKYEKKSVTFLQMTPTLFLNFGQDVLKNVVLSQNSSLRICLLGGEAFPKKCLIPNSNDHIRFFNIYGITEISCWSHLREVNLRANEEVDIGDPLDDSIEMKICKNEAFPANEFGELSIGSNVRKCILEDENAQEVLENDECIFRNTGDVVELKKGKYFFRTRSNKIIKKFGNQVNLAKIEREANKIDAIDRVTCIFVEKCKKIVLFYKSDKEIVNLIDDLRRSLCSSEIPDEVLKIEMFPMSNHGKVTDRELLNLYEKISKEKSKYETIKKDILQGFHKLLEQFLNSNFSPTTSFTNQGGDSVKALQLIGEMKEIYLREFPELLQMLLDPETQIQNIENYLKSIPGHSEEETQQVKLESLPYKLEFKWKVNLDKCIDATPSIYGGNNVTVGSHSHKLITVDIVNGNILYQDKLEDRVESQVAFCPDGFGFIGCYRGFLYKFSVENKRISWKFNSMAMIKCRPLLIGDFVIFGNYNDVKNVWCICRKSGDLIWSTKIGKKGILANPLAISKDVILVATLDGTVATLNTKNGSMINEIIFKSPIFSSPTLIRGTKDADNLRILIAQVNGTISLLKVSKNSISCLGNPFKVSGNIFSGITILHDNVATTFVTFGCHNSCIYCLGVQAEEPHLCLKWKTKLESPVFSTPCCITKDSLVCCTTSGKLMVLCSGMGRILCCEQLPGEVFSSPTTHEDRIFIGCRDNHLYCYKYSS